MNEQKLEEFLRGFPESAGWGNTLYGLDDLDSGDFVKDLARALAARLRNEPGSVWLTEKHGGGGPADVLGIFSTPEDSEKVCQDDADAYFGPASTPPLRWLKSDGYESASYHHPACGMFLFQITRFTVDEKVTT